ncbi:hypothetical protein LTR22_024921 [Elasticomyces elasticus]|nr:hypothetical protein LTR22_024921 [Elasticomyces elasticus]KAK5742287.1 hypothetical protein LTS12_024301 [Elasticomyces elasticus]
MGGRRGDIAEEEDRPTGFAGSRTTSTNSVPSFLQPLRSPSRLGSASRIDAEVQRDLAERDRMLEEQAANLAEMERSATGLSSFHPPDGRAGGSCTALAAAVRETNEKISLMTQEFDSHHAGFRITLGSLESASTETERVYEEQKTDLLAHYSDLQRTHEDLRLQNEALHEDVAADGSRGAGLEDFEGNVSGLKRLEELVAEWEEGLEKSRRGEVEAGGEVEFLPDEVERGRSGSKRQKEKAAAVLTKSDGGSKKGWRGEGR